MSRALQAARSAAARLNVTGQPFTPEQLAAALGVTPEAARALVDQLRRAGYIRPGKRVGYVSTGKP